MSEGRGPLTIRSMRRIGVLTLAVAGNAGDPVRHSKTIAANENTSVRGVTRSLPCSYCSGGA